MCRLRVYIFTFCAVLMFTGIAYCSDEIKFDFEESMEDWKIPDWAYDQKDHKAIDLQLSDEKASSGKNSLKMICEFPGDVWKAAIIDWERNVDLTGYDTISVDIFLPKGAPKGIIKARLILTIGDGWHFTEQRAATILQPGKWTTLTGKIESEDVKESDWKGRKLKRFFRHVHNIKKIAIRIEYDAAPPFRIGKKYHGPVYIDNIVIE